MNLFRNNPVFSLWGILWVSSIELLWGFEAFSKPFDKKELEKCVSSIHKKKTLTEEECLEKSLEGVSTDPTAALQAAKYVRSKYFAYNALPFFVEAIKDKNNGVCEDEDLELAIIAGLKLPKSHEMLPKAKTLAFEACWPKHQESIVGELQVAGPESYLAANVCETLKNKKALSDEEKGFCKK